MITLIPGTNRPGSNSARIADALTAIYTGLGESPARIDLADLPPGLFLPSAYRHKPPEFAPFVAKVVGARGLVVITPEYNGSYPGILKHFIDMLPYPQGLDGLPVCLVGLSAGAWGALRAVEQLQEVLCFRNAPVYPGRVFVPRCGAAFDECGGLKDEGVLGRLRRQAAGFLAFAGALESIRPRPRAEPARGG